MLKLIEKIMDKFLLPNKHFQEYVNTRYKKEEWIIIRKKFIENIYCKYDGFEFIINDQIDNINNVCTEYMFSDIKKTDIVLDVGANIGAFTIFSSKNAKHVFAVEPLFVDVINKNLSKNNIKNVTVFETALGNYGRKNIKYGDKYKSVDLIPLREIIIKCGGHVDFLKCDCEGGEWSIKPEELKGIRRIEMEVHCYKGMPNFKDFETILQQAGFKYQKNVLNNELMIIHAKRIK